MNTTQNDSIETKAINSVTESRVCIGALPGEDGTLVMYYKGDEAAFAKASLASSKEMASATTKAARVANRENAEQADADKERRHAYLKVLGHETLLAFELVAVEAKSKYEAQGFDSRQLAMDFRLFVQDGNQPGFADGSLQTALMGLNVRGLASPIVIKSDRTLEDGKADKKTADRGIVRGKDKTEKAAS